MQVGRPSEPPSIALVDSLESFFREAVTAARARHQVEASLEAEAYLASLLASQAHLTAVTEGQPLTLLLADALEGSGPERFERLRQIGDGVLYTTGFFGEHMGDRGHSVPYLQQLGADAYRAAGHQMKGEGSLFFELAGRFGAFARLLRDVAESVSASAVRSHRAVLELYERWLATGSDAIGHALLGCGVWPTRRGRMQS